MRPDPVSPSCPPGASPRDLLVGMLGWRTEDPGVAWLEADARRYRVERLARLGGVTAVRCESPLGAPLPDYAARRRARRALNGAPGEYLIVFQDAAGTEQLWSWYAEAPGAAPAYHERRRLPGAADEPLIGELEAISAARAGVADPRRCVEEVLEAVRPAVRRLAGARAEGWPGPGPELPRRVQAWVEEIDSLAVLRALWRALSELTVLDPGCGSGSWLLRAAATLEPVYLACLERMQVWLDDEDRAGRLAHGRLADLRRLLERADDTRLYPTRRAFAREVVVLRNLHGADANSGAVAACRARLMLYLRSARGGETPELPGRVCRVHEGRAGTGFGSYAELLEVLAPQPGGSDRARRMAEEAEAIGRADRFLRRLRLEDGATARDLERGVAAVQRRLQRLRVRLDRLHPDGGDAAGRPLHTWAVYHDAMRRGGFRVVREVSDAGR